MLNNSSRKRSNLRAQTTQEEKGRARPDVLTTDLVRDVRRSARIAQRRSIKETPAQQDTSPQTTLLHKAGQRNKEGGTTKRRAVKPSAPSRAGRKGARPSPVKGKQREPESSQLARQGNQNSRKGSGDRVLESSGSVRPRTLTAQALSAQREQKGSDKIIERVTTTGRSSRGKRGRGRGGRQRTSSEEKASETSEAVDDQLREEAQGKALSRLSASQKESSRKQTEAADASRQASPDVEQTRQENPTKEAQISAWAYQVVSPSPERVKQEQALRELDVPLITSADMNTTTVSSTDYARSTVKGKRGKSVKVSPPKLRYRRVSLNPKPENVDPRLTELRQVLKTQLPERTIADVPAIPELLKNFLARADANKTESCYTFVDDLSFELDKQKSSNQLPTVNAQYFKANLLRCLTMNEAVLQRTIMMTISNQHWLDQKFDWNAESQWSQKKDSRIPSRLDDEISQPKPDLAISFTRQTFTGFDFSDPIPPALEECISPEGHDRCFPFLLMEVKKAASDLQEAYLSNLNNASQALYNMYQWMAQANEIKKFEDKIRVFTLVFNAEDMLVRVHRCKQEADGNLYFYFEELKSLVRYSRDEAWVLINSILEDYAAKELHPTLEIAYKAVVKQTDQTTKAKRKAEATQRQSAKRTRGSISGGLDHTNSFGIGALNT
ncbi:MAG: hypothetical protein Q9165_008907 [Trypethelium subeluteriae]